MVRELKRSLCTLLFDAMSLGYCCFKSILRLRMGGGGGGGTWVNGYVPLASQSP